MLSEMHREGAQGHRQGHVGLQARARRATADLEKLPRLFKELPSFLEKLSALATLSLLEGGERGGAASSSWLGRRKLTPLEADDGRDDAVVDLAGEELSVADDLAPLPLRCSNDLRPSCTGGDEGGGGDGGGDGGCGYGGCVGGGCGNSSCGNEGGDGEGGE